MMMYPDDRVLVAVVNNLADWQRVLNEGWYRIPAKKAPEVVPHFEWLAFYFTAKFGDDRHAIHYYAAVQGHELVTRRDLIPVQPDHSHANEWYYKLSIGPVLHKLPPITSHKWRRITFILTTGDRFENAIEINDLFDRESPLGQLYVTLKEQGHLVEQFWTMQEAGGMYTVDLAIATKQGWLPINVSPRHLSPPNTLQLPEISSLDARMAQITLALENKTEAESSNHQGRKDQHP